MNTYASQAERESPLIHLIENELEQARHMTDALGRAHYRVRHFSDWNTFVTAVDKDENSAAVIIDMTFLEGDLSGAEAIEKIHSKFLNCPPVLFLSESDDILTRLSAHQTGASRFLVKPVEAGKLVRSLDQLACRIPTQAYRVLLVDSDPLLLNSHAEVLRQAGMVVHTEQELLKTLDAINKFKPDVLLLDDRMPDINSLEFAAVLNEDEAFASLPILFLSSEADLSKQLMELNLGDAHFLTKPVEHDHLVNAVVVCARKHRETSDVDEVLKHSLYEKRREHLALNHHAIVSVADATGNITYVNDLFCETSGYSREELIGNNHRIIKSEVHSDAFFTQMWTTISEGNVWQGDLCNRRKDGSHYWVESTIVPFMDKAGLPYQYVSIRTDITHVKHVEKQATTAAERLRRSQIFANIGTWDWNIQTDDLFWSERIAPLFGYPDGELETTYENFIAAVHPDDRDKVVNAVNACIEGRAEYNMEHRVIWPDGQIRWLQEKGDITLDKDGKPQHMLGVVMDIHNLKMAEKARQESEERLVFAVEGAGDGIWDWDMPSGEMLFSGHYEEMLGFNKGGLEKTIDAWVSSVHPDDLSRVQQNLQEYLEGKIPHYSIELRLRCKDGSYKWILCRGTIVERDGENKPLRMIGIHSDITRRKQADEKLSRFKSTLDGLNDCVWMFEPASLKFFYINQGTVGQLGYSEAEMMNMTVVDIKPEYDEAKFRQMISPLISGEMDALSVETVHRHKSGQLIPVEISLQYVEPKDGSARFVAVVRNTTERMEADNRLRESEERNRLLLESVGEGVYGLDTEGKATFVNPAACEILGYTAEEMIGQPMHELIHHSFPDGSPYPADGCLINAVLTNGKTYKVDNEVFWCKDGSSIPVEYTGMPVMKDDVIVGVVATFADISERIESEHRVRTGNDCCPC
ncbi:MAG: PAS domain S-box protein [Pseudomonadota bacterium]